MEFLFNPDYSNLNSLSVQNSSL